MKVLSCAAMRELEGKAVSEGVTLASLMENAGSAFADAALSFVDGKANPRAFVLCGKGNNGGDGLVAARHLAQKGVGTAVLLTDGVSATDLAKEMLSRLPSSCKVYTSVDAPEVTSTLSSSDVILDAVYGIGFHGKVNEKLSRLFDAVNALSVPRVSADIPSGIPGDSGHVEGSFIKADLTVTFTALKSAHILYPSCDACGKIEVKDVGIPPHLLENAPSMATLTDLEEIKALFPPRVQSSHKGTYGTLSLICGSYGMAGAAILSARAALRCGAGLVRVICTAPIYPILASSVYEAIYSVFPAGNDGSISRESLPGIISKAKSGTACLAGCGMGNTADTQAITAALLCGTDIPLVLDADALNALSTFPHLLKEATRGGRPVILTPHPGEMGRLTGCGTKQVQENRLDAAKDYAKEHGVTLVLKGSNTLIASPDGRVAVNRTGNPGMARGGSGDVLAGMIASFLAQRIPAFEAAKCAVMLHGFAGDRCANSLTQQAMLPSDMIEELPSVFKDVLG